MDAPSPAAVLDALGSAGYLADDHTATVVFLADKLGKPVLVEGPAGTGKTELARSISRATGRRLIRLQCYEGLDESRALFEWNYRKQLLRLQASAASEDWATAEQELFREEFVLERPLLAAVRAPDPVVLLVDEVDRLDVETEALLLEVLSDYQVSIPELGTVAGTQVPAVFLTSNRTRELSEALKRRCLYLHLNYPAPERERAIVTARVPGLAADLAESAVAYVHQLRALDLRKVPSVAETLDWARTLLLLGVCALDEGIVRDTIDVLLKHQADIDAALASLTSEQLPHQEMALPDLTGPR